MESSPCALLLPLSSHVCESVPQLVSQSTSSLLIIPTFFLIRSKFTPSLLLLFYYFLFISWLRNRGVPDRDRHNWEVETGKWKKGCRSEFRSSFWRPSRFLLWQSVCGSSSGHPTYHSTFQIASSHHRDVSKLHVDQHPLPRSLPASTFDPWHPRQHIALASRPA